jgi:hypothetical protein
MAEDGVVHSALRLAVAELKVAALQPTTCCTMANSLSPRSKVILIL